MADRDYVLGTHDEEINRLGFQHRVWRTRALDAWKRAGIDEGARVIDFGAGPGFATMDLAEIVGPTGRVFAFERSRRFLSVLQAHAQARALTQVEAEEIDFATDALPVKGADAAWVRWVLTFLPDPKSALKKLVDSLRPGGALVIHEYLDYRTCSFTAETPFFDRFIDEVVANWRAAGGEPDIARSLPAWLREMGLTLESYRPHVDVVSKEDTIWRWPVGFFEIHIDRLLELGRIDSDLAANMHAELARISEQPGTLLVTPMVLENHRPQETGALDARGVTFPKLGRRTSMSDKKKETSPSKPVPAAKPVGEGQRATPLNPNKPPQKK
ncbi:MAG: methyltransferase domain-containing protein [Hyphomonadaceae bacterium]